MELPVSPPATLVQKEPSVIHTLQNVSLDLLTAGDDIIIMRFTPDNQEYEVIDVPWEVNQFRLMISGWLARLGERNNGSATAET